MENFMMMLLLCSVTMSVIALLYLLLTPLIKRRYSEKGRYYVWLIIVIGFIIPFRPQFENVVFSIEIPIDVGVPAMEIGDERVPDINVNTPSALLPNDGANNNIQLPPSDNIILPPSENGINNMIEPEAAWHLSWVQIVFSIWLTGAIIFIAYQGFKHYQFIKITQRWSECVRDESVLSLFQRITLEMKITQRIELHLCCCVGSPMLIGLIKPRILLPSIEIDEGDLYFILKHELVHYKRKDILYKHLVLVATAIHWFNPVIYLMAKSINILCEMSCDVAVVRDMGIEHRQTYSKAIINIVRHQSKLKTALSTNFNGGKKDMKRRILSIKEGKIKKWGVLVLSIVFVLTVGTGFLIVLGNSYEPEMEELELLGNAEDDYLMHLIENRIAEGFDAWGELVIWAEELDIPYRILVDEYVPDLFLLNRIETYGLVGDFTHAGPIVFRSTLYDSDEVYLGLHFNNLTYNEAIATLSNIDEFDKIILMEWLDAGGYERLQEHIADVIIQRLDEEGNELDESVEAEFVSWHFEFVADRGFEHNFVLITLQYMRAEVENEENSNEVETEYPTEGTDVNQSSLVGTWRLMGNYRYNPSNSEWIFDDSFAGSHKRYDADGSFVTFVFDTWHHYLSDRLVPTEAGEYISIIGTWLTMNGSLEKVGRNVLEEETEVEHWTGTYSIDGNIMFWENSKNPHSRSKYVRVEDESGTANTQLPVNEPPVIDNSLVGTWNSLWEDPQGEARSDSQTIFNSDGTGYIVNFGEMNAEFRWEVRDDKLVKTFLPSEFQTISQAISQRYRIEGNTLILTLLSVEANGDLVEVQDFYYERIN